MKAPREYTSEELKSLKAPILIIASEKDIFFPAGKVFKKAEEIFVSQFATVKIDSKHLPSQETMISVCEQAKEFFKKTSNSIL